MTFTASFRQVVVIAWCLLAGAMTASAQVTTGSIGGTVKDPQGGVIPGATVILISETQNTKSTPVVTNETGDFVFVNVKSDTYTLEVTMDRVQDRPEDRRSSSAQPSACRRVS